VYPDPKLVSDRKRGEALARSLGTHRAVLMRAHGVAVTGSDVAETVAGAFPLEENARRAWIAASMGKPVWLDDATAAAAGAELVKSRGPFRRVWALVEADSEGET
jgi:ribulose-5-phosphate 4-epimerase/fuculose-1-phosphate aldolase